MFTGIIEEIGIIKEFSKNTHGASITIGCTKILEDLHTGDSICVNGTCQTVVHFNKDSFSTTLSNETLNVTNFSDAKIGDYVNLERALTLNSRLGGHIVSGHIDCTGRIERIEECSEFNYIKIEIPTKYTKYVAYKCSVTINGISLTVSEVKDNIITTAVIPHTLTNTNLKYLKCGDIVNIETDIIAKYIEKILKFNDNNIKSEISMEFLKDNGFV